MLQLSLAQLPKLLNRLQQHMRVFAPVKQGEQTDFALWQGQDVDLDATKTARSPKSCVFPQSEDIVAFRMQGKTIDVIPPKLEEEDYLLFGARACDVAGLEVLDRVFLADPVDTFYQARRQHGYTVGYACSSPAASCFCTRFGVDPAEPNADVVVVRVGDALTWEARTQKGEALTRLAGDLLVPADAQQCAAGEKAKEQVRALAKRLPFADLDLAGFDGEHLQQRFDDPQWAELSASCLGCGTCTFVCPTCQCYDVRDFKTKTGVQRYRCWDSCMYSDFTMMAHGNPRTTQLQRFRQRFMHKLVYFPANNGGAYSCVGCGRCVDKCPASLHIAKVIKRLGGIHDGK